MVLLETLGPGTGLFTFPPEAIDAAMGTFRIKDFQSQNLLLANYAEFGAFNACMADTVKWPLLLPPAMLPFVVYKTNTITYTCGYHKGYLDRRSEYAFLFTSDCWKLREILHDEPLEQLLRDPLAVRQRVAESGWRQVGGLAQPGRLSRSVAAPLVRQGIAHREPGRGARRAVGRGDEPPSAPRAPAGLSPQRVWSAKFKSAGFRVFPADH